MPHLEENLRYTTRHSKRCLTDQALSTFFPVLRHPSLRGCRLQGELRDGDTTTSRLVCDHADGATGEAVWHVEEHRVRGVLNVKLGGKNMTFYQRITAIPLGGCPVMQPGTR